VPVLFAKEKLPAERRRSGSFNTIIMNKKGCMKGTSLLVIWYHLKPFDV
jgi:hypothetical protein